MSFDSSRSTNSAQKRSHNSNNSNKSSTSNGGKKKKVNQKTLGVAWGSNSVSSSRSSFRNSPFSDFGSYMEEKNRKLRDQFDSEASNSSRSASTSGRLIFHGVSIFVDGFTVPSNQELRGYMLKYGGRFENYFSRHRVTHIICSNLPDTKIKNLRSFSAGLPVVKPTWILDSVAANKLLSWVPYQLDQLAGNQPKLSDFFSRKSIPISDNASIPAICLVKPESECSSLDADTAKNAEVSELIESLEDERQIREDSETPLQDYTDDITNEQQNRVSGESFDVNMEELSSPDSENKISLKIEQQAVTAQPSVSVNSYCSENRITKGSASSPVLGASSKRHSTLGDPNFVENYFKSSRLHFIGTWRNRYRKRFPNSSWSKCSSSGLKVPPEGQRTCIIHVDMDCVFVSVIIRNHPEMKDKPVAICHSDNPQGTAEISSANYPARDYGVKAGMFVRDAKVLCPNLVIYPYNFEAYEEVADQFYNILHKHCNKVQAVSCDEAFLDVTDLEVDPEVLALEIRREILETTGCTASVGISGNMLMARLATRTAKPDGQCHISPEGVDKYLDQLPIKALPGIGHVLEEKLKKQHVRTCGELRLISKDSLQKDFGKKTGEMLWNYCRGVDNRLVGMIQESKSIGAEVNWGVRFRDLHDSQRFLTSLCKEVSLRLQGCGMQGRTFTLKIKKRKKGADEPVKYMGCGECDNLSHSMTVPVATDDVEVLQRIAKQLFGSYHLDVKDIRGVGLQVSRLQSTDVCRRAFERNTLTSWLMSASAGIEDSTMTKGIANIECLGQSSGGATGQLSNTTVLSVQSDHNLSNGQASSNPASVMPPLSDLDVGVIENLPPELFSELNNIYGGKLVDFIAKNKNKNKNIRSFVSNVPAEPQVLHGLDDKVEISVSSNIAPLISIPVQLKIEQRKDEEDSAVPVPGAGVNSEAIPPVDLNRTDLMPSSLSQVDTTVLQQLPEDMKADILELLPAHRGQEFVSNAASDPPEVAPKSIGFSNTEDLWVGNPPRWVHKFKSSNLSVLNILGEIFESGSTESLSQIFQHAFSIPLHPPEASSDCWDEAIFNLCELLKQYIKQKIAVDIEEVYLCFRLLRRITMKSELFLQVYSNVLPYLQTSVGENYGGSMHI